MKTTFLLLFFSILVVRSTVSIPVEDDPTPWITRPVTCGASYVNCVEIDFTKVPSGDIIYGSSVDFNKKFLLQAVDGGEDGTDSCAKPDPGTTRCLYSSKNVRIANGILELLVPGGIKPGVTIPTALVIFSDPTVFNSTFILNGYFDVEAQTSPVPGTCQAVFTQANPGYPQQKDEQDIEILTGHYTKPNSRIPAGLQLTSWAAFPVNDSMPARMVNFVVPYGYDPTSDFYTYSIQWNRTNTVYTYGTKVKNSDIYSSQNPSKLCINNWSNASPYWTEGPPLEDNILRIRKIKVYYNTKE